MAECEFGSPCARAEDPLNLGFHRGGVTALAVLPDGRLITAGGDRRFRAWIRRTPVTRRWISVATVTMR